jgi:putative DNA primase/helicase
MYPWTVKITDSKKNIYMVKILEAEAPGILRWAVEGCLFRQAHRVEMPKQSKEAVQLYRDEQRMPEIMEEFVRETFQVISEAFIPSKTILDRYESWSGHKSYPPIPNTRNLADALRAVGAEQDVRKLTGQTVRGWKHVELVPLKNDLPFVVPDRTTN